MFRSSRGMNPQFNNYFDSFHRNPRGELQSSYYNPFMVKPRKRTTKSQLKVLEKTFETIIKPDAALRKKLGHELGMTPREVQVWFQNRRAKVKKLNKKVHEDKRENIQNHTEEKMEENFYNQYYFPETHMFTPITPKEFNNYCNDRYPASPIKENSYFSYEKDENLELPNAENLDSSWMEYEQPKYKNERICENPFDPNNFFTE
ncbi:Homeodomain protein [Spraguea lophii 42_110]|uniref:Homeodomain protein n=1 Tax=Spraguea lophii (strain 42_110) TaxID=1358809 RepID=S7W9U9_SPRLO|nr:Homeodomain protein [Spraguea lophii 42_110]